MLLMTTIHQIITLNHRKGVIPVSTVCNSVLHITKPPYSKRIKLAGIGKASTE